MTQTTTLPPRSQVPVEQTWDLESIFATPADWETACQQLQEMLDILTEKEREIILMRFGLNQKRACTLEETGRHFGLTRERIRQIEVTALKKLRAHLRRSTSSVEDIFNG